MKKIVTSALACSAILGSFSSVSAADGINILNDIKMQGEIRPRYEMANEHENGTDKADAITNRLHLSVTAGLLGVENLTTTLGIQTVNNFGYNDYNSLDNGQTQYDKIVDPQFAMLSEAAIDYKTGATALHAGRSHVNLDNQRFIGTVGWRQNERSYDTVYVANNSVKNLSLLGAWVYGYQGVKANPTADTNSILLHLNYKVSDALNITAYDYMIASFSDTMGIALTGNVNVGAKLAYRAEFAMQGDATMEIHGAEGNADATYMNLDLGTNLDGILLGANYELLSGADGSGKTEFKTPLGTNHKFNGWADKFLGGTTLNCGLQDINVRAGYKAKGFGKFLAVYHMFTADTAVGGKDDLGTEFDAVYVNKISTFKNLTGLLKTAYYMGGDVAGYDADKTVFWAQLDYKFSTK